MMERSVERGAGDQAFIFLTLHYSSNAFNHHLFSASMGLISSRNICPDF
jgi:hypothetical protein